MAGQFGMVDNSLWRHPKFKGLSDDAKQVFLYLKTCSHQNSIGCFYMPIGYASADLNWSGIKGMERVSKGFKELSSDGFIRYCDDTETVFLLKHLDLHPIQGPKQMIGAEKQFIEINNNFKYINELANKLLESKHINHDDLKGFRYRLEGVSIQEYVYVDVKKDVNVNDLGSNEPMPKQVWHCDQRKQISDAYNRSISTSTKEKFTKWSDKRIAKLKTRCNEDESRDLGWWLRVMDDIPRHSAAMSGDWFTLDFLIHSEDNLIKFLEGKYLKSFNRFGGNKHDQMNAAIEGALSERH